MYLPSQRGMVEVVCCTMDGLLIRVLCMSPRMSPCMLMSTSVGLDRALESKNTSLPRISGPSVPRRESLDRASMCLEKDAMDGELQERRK